MTDPHALAHPAEWYQVIGPDTVDAQLQLLDRQLVDPDGVPVSTVDDVELDGCEPGSDIRPGTRVTVSALLIGSTLFPRVFGGRMPPSRWERVAWSRVDRLGTVIRLRVHADDLDVTWVERWFRDRVIARIPGGRHDPD